jgi:hypothetical protein
VNQVVARFLDGTILKGDTADFLPTKGSFHITPFGPPEETKPLEVHVADLKALYFVRSLFGDSRHQEAHDFVPGSHPPGRKIQITFRDGEVLLGTTQGYQPGRPGFFVVPADPASNNERCFIVTSSTRSIDFA